MDSLSSSVASRLGLFNQTPKAQGRHADKFTIDITYDDGAVRTISLVVPKRIRAIKVVHERPNTYPWDNDDPDEDGVFLRSN